MKTLLEWIDGLIPGTWSEPFFHWHQKRIILEDKQSNYPLLFCLLQYVV